MFLVKKILRKYNNISIAAKAVIWFVFCNMLQKCMSLITTPIFTRLMNEEQYGQFSIYNSYLSIFTIITTLRLNYAVFNKGMSKFKNDRDGYTSTMQTITTMLTFIVFGVYLVFQKQINELTELPSFIMFAIFAELLVTPAISFWTLRKRYDYIYRPVVFRTLLMTVLNTILGVIAVYFADEKGYARIISCVFVNLCFGVTLYIYNLRKGKKIFCFQYAVFAVSFNVPLLLHYLSVYILDQFDRIMIQKMVSFAAAGLYGVAYNVGMVIKIFTQSINNVLVPWQYDRLEKKEIAILDDTLFLIYLGLASIIIMFSACAPEMMKILADKKYHEAVNVIPPVVLGLFFSFIYTTIANIELYYNQNKFTMYISMVGAALNIGLNYIGIKMFGYIAAAYTTLICYVILTAMHYLYTTHCVKMALKINKVFITGRLMLLSIAVIVIGLFVIILYDMPVIRYGMIIAGILLGNCKRSVIINTYRRICYGGKK